MGTPKDRERLHSADSEGETPDTPAVIEATEHERLSSYPPLSAGRRVAIVSAVVGTLLMATLEKGGPKTPRTPPVISRKEAHGHGGADSEPPAGNGDGTDPEFCGRDPLELYPSPKAVYGADGKHVVEESDNPLLCEFGTAEDGTQVVRGVEVTNENVSNVCFFTPVWAPDAVMRLAGTLEHNMQYPGRIHLKDGLLEIQSGALDSAPGGAAGKGGAGGEAAGAGAASAATPEKKIVVRGEASLVVTSTGRVSVTLLPPEGGGGGASGKSPKLYVLVSAQEGDAVVVQEGRDEQIVVKECEDLKIPLDVRQLDGGCYIAEGSPGSKGFAQEGTKFILLAGAAFLALRRRRKGEATPERA